MKRSGIPASTPNAGIALCSIPAYNCRLDPMACPPHLSAQRLQSSFQLHPIQSVTRPRLVINALPHPAGKRRMRPLADQLHKTMFDRIVMNVIHMPGVIALIANGVFPITALPDAPLSLAQAACRAALARLQHA